MLANQNAINCAAIKLYNNQPWFACLVNKMKIYSFFDAKNKPRFRNYVIGKSHTQPSASDSEPWTNVAPYYENFSNIRCLSLMHTDGIFHKFIVDKNANTVFLERRANVEPKLHMSTTFADKRQEAAICQQSSASALPWEGLGPG